MTIRETKNHQRVIIFLILGLFSCVQEKESIVEKDADKPNIVLIVSDDHGLDAVGCYGNQVIQTPNIDQLAQDGTKFTDAFCTSASCSASRSTLLTGQFNHAIGHYGHAHDFHHFSTFDSVKTLPVILDQNNYRTARIGKYHLAPESVYFFQEVLEADPRNTIEMAENSSDFINKNDEPFFLYFCTDDPHRGHPFTPDPWNAPNSFGNLENGYEGVTQISYSPEEVIVPDYLPDTETCRAELANYYQSVSRIDQGVGRLINELKKAGKYENTVIIYISDNGIAFPGAKTTVYEPGIKLPCIIKSPNQENKGVTTNKMVSWVDLMPTILDYAGINYQKQNFHGESFYGKTESVDSIDSAKEKIYASHTFHEVTMYYPMRVVRERQYKLIWNIAYGLTYPFASDLWISSTYQDVVRNEKEYFGKRTVEDYLNRTEFELYDLKNDPEEIINLANDPKYLEVLKRLKSDMKKFQFETRDPWYSKWDNESVFSGTGVNL
ncbi:MAG: sulfatase [Reichenbachiella sp.]